ncbi:hypothetical protein SDC9_195540 [bioreactor metagenome]|uniref:Uncharacterized protein n=1 Tax=bioreactor metagenome TaxID=1076179 RepID=A0A645IAJ6_9ZZZZ
MHLGEERLNIVDGRKRPVRFTQRALYQLPPPVDHWHSVWAGELVEFIIKNLANLLRNEFYILVL